MQALTDRRDLRRGAIGIVVVLLIALGAFAVRMLPIGVHEYTADIESAQSVRVGDDVRMAGVPVGEVTSLDLRADQVTMRFTVDSDVFVGDQSTIDVRMLTVVGGDYVALTSVGSESLGDRTIPQSRVRLPYSLMQTFQDAQAPVSELVPGPMRDASTRLADAFEQAPESVRGVLRSAQALIDTVNRQRADVSKAAELAAEYTTTINRTRTDLGRLVAKVLLLEDLLVNNRTELREAVQTLSRVTWRIGALEPAYTTTLRPMAVEIAKAAAGLSDVADSVDGLITNTRSIADTLQKSLLPADRPADATFCIPVPGKDC